MTNWNIYNASMEIAARCNQIFSKLFIYKVSPVWIEATPCYNIYSAPYHIHMVMNKANNTLTVVLNFNSCRSLKEYTDSHLNAIAYSIGHDIADKFAILEDRAGFIFVFSDNINYNKYQDHYEFIVNGKVENIDTDLPLIHHMKTEFDVEFFLYNDSKLDAGISDIIKNGKHLFDIVTYMNKPNWGIIRIEKKESEYLVYLQNCNFFNNRLYQLKTLSYIGQYSILEKIPSLQPKENMNPFIEIYMGGDAENNYVSVERIRNYGMKPTEIKNAIPQLCKEFNITNDVDWANYLFI